TRWRRARRRPGPTSSSSSSTPQALRPRSAASGSSTRSGSGTSDVALAAVPTGVTLQPGSFYVFGGSAYAGGHPADQSFTAGLAAAGGGVALRDGDGSIVDSMGWGT